MSTLNSLSDVNITSPINGERLIYEDGVWVNKLVMPETEEWVRNASWPECEANEGDNKIVGLYAVWPGDGLGTGGNFFAMTVSDAYTIDFGDGTTANYSSGQTAYYDFDYNNANLSGTDAPVTFVASTSTVNRVAHGYSDSTTVQFYNVVTTTEVVEGQTYYVINATLNSFQISLTVGGPAVDLTNDGSATLLPYKIATVTITPQEEASLTSVDFFVKHNQTGLANGYSTGWLDIAIASATITTLTIGSSALTVRHGTLEQVKLNELGAITTFASLFRQLGALRNVLIADSITTVTDMANMFNGCNSLTSVPLFNTANVTAMNSMFSGCNSLTSVPQFNTANVTTMSSMFNGCNSLTSVPLFNTAKVTSMVTMFSNCNSLTSVPQFNTANVTAIGSMFNGCNSLTSVPLFNTANVTAMNSMFSSCTSLTSVPLLNTTNVTTMSNMFQFCVSLTSVPLFNTAKVTSMGTMFSGCNSLTSVPQFNTANVTAIGSMFNGCNSLTSVPLLNTTNVTTMSNMFNGCNSLTSVPAIVTTAVTNSANFNNMFATCNSLSRIQAKDFHWTFSVSNCKLSAAALGEIYTNLPRVTTSQTITVTGNWGLGTSTSKTSLSLTEGATVVSIADTSDILPGMFVSGIGTGITTGAVVTSDVTAETLTRTAHGLSNGDLVSFSSIGTTGGILTWTIYFVVNKTDDTFQIALTPGGDPINLTGSNSSMTLRYPSFVTTVTTDTSVTLSTPIASTDTQTLTFRELDSSPALLKNWAVTF